jgi:hypothetical protein
MLLSLAGMAVVSEDLTAQNIVQANCESYPEWPTDGRLCWKVGYCVGRKREIYSDHESNYYCPGAIPANTPFNIIQNQQEPKAAPFGELEKLLQASSKDPKNRTNEVVKLAFKINKQGKLTEVTYNKDLSEGVVLARDVEVTQINRETKEVTYKVGEDKAVTKKYLTDAKITTTNHEGIGHKGDLEGLLKHVATKDKQMPKLNLIIDKDGAITAMNYLLKEAKK